MSEQRLFEVKTATIAFLGEVWERNYTRNKQDIARTPGVVGLFNRFGGLPAVLVGAGPSLDRNIRLLPLAKGKAVIISCDAALKILLENGITPDIVVNLDPQPFIANFFDGIDTRNMTLIAPTIVHPSLRESWKGAFFYYNKHAPDIPLLARISLECPHVGALIPGGSVLSVAFDLAFKSGADPIAFVGQDLGYTSEKAYAAGGCFDGYSAQEVFDLPGDTIVDADDIFGRSLKTQKSMTVTKQWFNWAFSNWDDSKKRRIYNCSESGILTGCGIIPFGEFVSRFCAKTANIAWTIKKASGSR